MMKKQTLGSLGWVAGLMLAASVSGSEATDAGLRHAAAEAIRTSPYLGAFDYVAAQVDAGHVRLTGSVEQRTRGRAVVAQIAKLPGVVDVADEIQVQGQSGLDMRLRRQLYERIYYAGAMPGGSRPEWPVKIVVSEGRVMLAGEVARGRDRERLEAIAWRAGAQQVENRLETSPSTVRVAAER